jgi:hypothetical protein
MMHDVVVYLSSLPRIADRNRKVETLQAFAQGARAQGANVLLQTDYRVVPARLAVILGWVGTKINGQHIQLRQSAIDFQRQSGNKIMSIDGSCFKFADPTSIFLRYSLDGVYYNTDNYANKDSDPDKWAQVQQRLNLNMRPWRSTGDHILVCGQRDGGWSMKGVDMPSWTMQTVKQIRQHTNRRIVVRPHPRFPMSMQLFRGIPNVTVSTGTTLEQDLKNAWASVFFNSSSCVASILAGVPVFAGDTDCVAWDISNKDLAGIETPALVDRAQWLYDLSAAHWTDAESQSGAIYQKFLPFLPT